jgi:hypothetical protein
MRETTMRTIEQNRIQIDSILHKRAIGLVAIIGPCSNQLDDLIVDEGVKLSKEHTSTMMPVHRIPPWKPRSAVPSHLPQPWEGLEQTEPEEALLRTQAEVNRGVAVAIEFGFPAHVQKYGALASFGWIGSRNVDNRNLAQSIRLVETQDLPVGVKNGMRGRIDSAIQLLAHVDGTGVPIFRGGDECQDPKSWERMYRLALDKTEGKMIVDIAHGGEMAHDPNGDFKKSIIGQIACMEHVLELANLGLAPTGIMIEASDHVYNDTHRKTDPNMPFDTALNGAKKLHDIILGLN